MSKFVHIGLYGDDEKTIHSQASFPYGPGEDHETLASAFRAAEDYAHDMMFVRDSYYIWNCEALVEVPRKRN